MPDAETATDQAAILALLAKHSWFTGLGACRCGWTTDTRYCGAEDRHRVHVAAVIAQARAADTGDRETLTEEVGLIADDLDEQATYFENRPMHQYARPLRDIETRLRAALTTKETR